MTTIQKQQVGKWVVVRVSSTITQEAKLEGHEFKVSLVYVVRPYLKSNLMFNG